MRLLIVWQGEWGQRIADHLEQSAPQDWTLTTWRGPVALPLVIDDPDEFLPGSLPETDLLLVLTESPGLTDLVPDMVSLCGAEAVIVALDRRSAGRPGLRRQVRQRLQAQGVDSAFPMPFCSLVPSTQQHPWIATFARHFGRPELTFQIEGGRIGRCAIVRETPCGNTSYIAENLVGARQEDAVEKAGLLHHYYPCWGGMEADPVSGEHTLLHIAATLAQKAVARTLKSKHIHQEGKT